MIVIVVDVVVAAVVIANTQELVPRPHVLSPAPEQPEARARAERL